MRLPLVLALVPLSFGCATPPHASIAVEPELAATRVGITAATTPEAKVVAAPAPAVAAPVTAPVVAAPAAALGASATIKARSGSRVTGSVKFAGSAGGKTRVLVQLTGLSPGGHGLHLHEKGDCSAPDAASAGGHWNPMSTDHGAPGAPAHHAGDLGNVVADASGKVEAMLESTDFALEGPMGVVGRSVVVHEKSDDGKSQPAGASGPRVGCGVVTGAK